MTDKMTWTAPDWRPSTRDEETFRAAEHLLRVAGANLAREVRQSKTPDPVNSVWFRLADAILDAFPELDEKR